MSYLSATRLHFSGRFQADPSTVNNDVQHYDNARFKPSDQLPQTPGHLNGWWNPRGTGAWRLIDCRIRQVHSPEAGLVDDPNKDPAVGLSVAGSDSRVAGSIVDLDPEQQLVSEIWGLTVRLTDGQHNLLEGQFKVAAFSDLWSGRASGTAGGDTAMSAFYQSVLTELQWGDISASPFLQALRDAAVDGALSIKFNVDSYNMNRNSPEFTLGRIVGSIGPALASEPRHFVAGRQFMPEMSRGAPAHRLFFACGQVDETNGKIVVDFGNALPTTAGSALDDIGPLALAVADGNDWRPLGAFPAYSGVDWYETTAGVMAFPPDRALTAGELAALSANPLAVLGRADGAWTPFVTESTDGLYVRADSFVRRLNPGDSSEIEFFATRYGQPLAQAAIHLGEDDRGIQMQVGRNDPPIGTPATALSYPSSATTDAEGRASITLTASDPGNPRGYIDGQLYGIGYTLKAITELPAGSYHRDPWNFISVLVWDEAEVPETVTWAEVQPILQQYGNLYPLMDGLVRLGDYEDVARHRGILLFAFGLERENPNHMPVTRDLSDAKRAIILKWLSDVDEEGLPLRAPEVPTAAAASGPGPGRRPEPELQALAALGGKTAARLRGGLDVGFEPPASSPDEDHPETGREEE